MKKLRGRRTKWAERNMSSANRSYAFQWFCSGCSSAQLGSLPCPTWQRCNRRRSLTKAVQEQRWRFFARLKQMFSYQLREIQIVSSLQTPPQRQRGVPVGTHISCKLLEDSAELFLLITFMMLGVCNGPAWWRLWAEAWANITNNAIIHS